MIPESRLKPRVDGSNRPPIFVRLTPRVLEGIAKKQSIKFELQGATARLMVGDLELSGTLQPDPGSFEVFTTEDEGYRSNGQVEKRLVLRDNRDLAAGAAVAGGAHDGANEAPASNTDSPASRESSSTTESVKRKSPSPKHRPLVHVAALGATTPAALARACNLPVEESREFLLRFATSADPKRTGAGDPFILDDAAYLYVRPWEHSYSPEDRKLAIDNCKAALDRMNIGPEHTARKSLKKPPTTVSKSSSPAAVVAAADKKKRELKSSSRGKETGKAVGREAGESSRDKTSTSAERDTKVTEEKAKKTKDSVHSVSPHKRPAAIAPVSQPGRKRPSTGINGSAGSATNFGGAYSSPSSLSVSPNSSINSTSSSSAGPLNSTVDLSKIAEKFHKTYSEYSDLYSTLDAAPERSRDASQVKKLLAMHRDLAEWKSLLWNSVGSKN